MTQAHRGSIYLEDAKIIAHHHWPDNQHILRLSARQCAKYAQAGQFVHLQCDESLPLRRPLSIMASDPDEGSIDLLYKAVGHGTSLLAEHKPGESLSLLGPIGNTFTLDKSRPHKLLIGGGVGIPPMIFLASHIASHLSKDIDNTLVLMGSESVFPFDLQASSNRISGIDTGCNTSLSIISALNISSRLASLQGYVGCHPGYVTDLAKGHLETLDQSTINQTEIFACGPRPMLKSVGILASTFNLPCQVSLEESMACGVGGCAGCAVQLTTDNGEAMKRVCVDGPVFDAGAVNF